MALNEFICEKHNYVFKTKEHLVRCQDCIHRWEYNNKFGCGLIDETIYKFGEDDCFCKYGERYEID